MTNGFTTGSVPAGTEIVFSIGGILNPVSTTTSSSFTYTTYDSSMYQIDVRNSGITVTMTSVGDFVAVGVTLASYVNGASNVYTFTMTASSPLSDGNYIYIKVPDTITPPVSPTCKGTLRLASSLT